ncbi:MAG: ABC transporter permease [Bryobacteraceae bacterium]
MWSGDYRFLAGNLILKDFRIRYRNMSLGAFWSLLNPLVMMGVLVFVFGKIFTNDTPHYPAFVLCGLVPYNFFTLAWASGTSSLVENAGLIKRVPVPREVIPVTSVLSNCVHLLIQIALLLVFVLGSGLLPNRYWLWLPVIWALDIIFVCGMALLFSGINVYIRDTRYVVESVNLVLFWLVPVFYGFERIPPQYHDVYQFNPVAAVVMALRKILLEGQPPAASTLTNLTLISAVSLAVGLFIFRRLKPRFYDYL